MARVKEGGALLVPWRVLWGGPRRSSAAHAAAWAPHSFSQQRARVLVGRPQGRASQKTCVPWVWPSSHCCPRPPPRRFCCSLFPDGFAPVPPLGQDCLLPPQPCSDCRLLNPGRSGCTCALDFSSLTPPHLCTEATTIVG